jgi:hypothetical protein
MIPLSHVSLTSCNKKERTRSPVSVYHTHKYGELAFRRTAEADQYLLDAANDKLEDDTASYGMMRSAAGSGQFE